MLNPFHDTNWHPDLRERRKFAASLVVGFPCVATALLLAQRAQSGAWNFSPAFALATVGVALGTVLWALPQIARPFYLVWHGVTGAFGFVIGNSLLAAIYLLLFAPTGLLLRTFGWKAMTKSPDRRATTYWRDAAPPASPARYFRQF